jgi:hypothetical protein
MTWQQRKTLTEGCKNAIVNSEQRLRDLYGSPCVVDMCPRISCSINWASVEALPIFEEGMSDKMSLFKVEKSSQLPTAEMPRLEFEAEIGKALPGLAYYLKHELVIDDATKETEANVRFGVKTYHHPAILEKLVDVKRHVSLADRVAIGHLVFADTARCRKRTIGQGACSLGPGVRKHYDRVGGSYQDLLLSWSTSRQASGPFRPLLQD